VDTHSTFTYDLLGNVTNQVDFGSGTGQEVNSSMQYTTCPTASTLVCLGAPLPGAGGVPPYWNNNLCPSWTSLPAVLTIRSGSAPGGGQVLRQRDGTPALCDNAAVTDLREKFGTGASDFAETQLGFDAWGSYNHITYPRNATGQQATVDSVYDASNHSDVVKVTDSHGLTATAVFDGPTGRIASRTDANGQVTSYTYDKFGRIVTITGPY